MRITITAARGELMTRATSLFPAVSLHLPGYPLCCYNAVGLAFFVVEQVLEQVLEQVDNSVSHDIIHERSAGVAQLVEQLTCNQQVVRSSRIAGSSE